MFKIYTYQLPFKNVFRTAAGTFSNRRGAIIRYHDAVTDIVAEAAPLPGFSSETLPEVLHILSAVRDNAGRFFAAPFTIEQLGSWLARQPDIPSVQFALSSLGLSLICIREECTLPQLFSVPKLRSVPMNGVLGDLPEQEFLTRANSLAEAGFTTLKCKVKQETGHLPGSLSSLHGTHPNLSFRLDANRSWPLDDVSKNSKKFSRLPVEYIEEPAPVATLQAFMKLRTICSLPVAADESISQFGLNELINQPKLPDRLIIKPTLAGNLIDLFATIRSRDHLDDKVIITTALESAVGTRMIAAIAALLGKPNRAHGLNTGTLFRKSIAVETGIYGSVFSFDEKMRAWFTFSQLNQQAIFSYPDG